MSKIKNGGLDQYGAGPFEQQQFGTAGVEGVKLNMKNWLRHLTDPSPKFYRVSEVHDFDGKIWFMFFIVAIILNYTDLFEI